MCRQLAGQDKLPECSSSTSPSTDVLAQISRLRQDLEYGGHTDNLIGIRNEMVQRSPSSGENSPYSWSKQRVFVSICLHETVI